MNIEIDIKYDYDVNKFFNNIIKYVHNENNENDYRNNNYGIEYGIENFFR